jgi:hypothetical protein
MPAGPMVAAATATAGSVRDAMVAGHHVETARYDGREGLRLVLMSPCDPC